MIRQPSSMHGVGMVRTPGALALVAVLMDGSSEMAAVVAAVDEWRMAVPRADWIGVKLPPASRQHAPHWFVRILSSELARRRMRPAQLVILGRGHFGRLALDRVLDGELRCAGAVVLDIPFARLRSEIGVTPAAIRLVLHARDRSPACTALIETIHSKGIDLRSIMLPALANDREQTLTRAARTFLVELVAKASRRETSG
jgi:hypothetical protein